MNASIVHDLAIRFAQAETPGYRVKYTIAREWFRNNGGEIGDFQTFLLILHRLIEQSVLLDLESFYLNASEESGILRHDSGVAKCPPHKFRELTAEELADKWMSVGAKCLQCLKHFGWRCKRSPDCICHYQVEIKDGKLKGIDELNYTLSFADTHVCWDHCMYCRLPQERK